MQMGVSRITYNVVVMWSRKARKGEILPGAFLKANLSLKGQDGRGEKGSQTPRHGSSGARAKNLWATLAAAATAERIGHFYVGIELFRNFDNNHIQPSAFAGGLVSLFNALPDPPSRFDMRLGAAATIAALTGWLGVGLAHNIQLRAHTRECFHEELHKDDKMTVTFQVGDREFGGAANLDIDFYVSKAQGLGLLPPKTKPPFPDNVIQYPDHGPYWFL